MKVIGLTGGTGSGKTTLVSLIPRFYDATQGAVRIGGMDIREIRRDELHKRIAVVPQKAMWLSIPNTTGSSSVQIRRKRTGRPR